MTTEIDGSVLEGGGQIIRLSIALSVLKSIPICLKHIRYQRTKPGLASQHLKGIQLARDLCGARLVGDKLGSTEITFEPGTLKCGHFSADAETAGSTALLLQVSLPCILFGRAETHLTLKGGTHADMAPQIDYTIHVLKPMLEKFGVTFGIELVKRGFFPAGQGIVKVTAKPVNELNPINLTEFGQVTKVYGQAFVAGVLPVKMADEMACAAENLLRAKLKISIHIERVKYNRDEAFGNGSGVYLVAQTSTGCYLGGSHLGRRQIKPEVVGRKAAEELLESIDLKVCADSRMQDQLVVFMALAAGRSRLRCGDVTLHTQTAIHISKLLTSANFTILDQRDGTNIIECQGIGLSRQQ